jgi:rhodanese-related sulfurtransferase
MARRLLIAAALIVAAAAALSTQGANLAELERDYAQQFPTIAHIAPASASNLIAAGDAVLVDARQQDEFAVSNIAGAIRVDPDSPADDVRARVGDVAGKTVIVYCTVGYRSSLLALRAQQALMAAGATSVANLRGGIFAWRNADMPLQSNGAATSRVHPFGPEWVKYLTAPDAAAR